ncbi:MAG: hypothetical protein HOV81_33525 [Kofleriaceae bacterium]|nr:hypothetical protein [Kofleriaceae bacterium]
MSPNEPNLALRGAPGALRSWIRGVVAAAALLTVAMVGLGGQLLYGQLDWAHSSGQWWLREGVALLVVGWIALSFVIPARNSPFIRLAVLLPVAHAGAIAIGWTLWSRVATHVTLDARSPLAAELPLAKLALVASLVFVLVALLVAKRRSGEWVHGFAVLALSELLLVGLWLPTVAAVWDAPTPSYMVTEPGWLAQLPKLVAWVVVPPTLAAIAYTVLVLRRSRWLAARKRLAVNTVTTLFCLACLARLSADADAMILYAHFVPVLLVAAVVAIAAIVSLAGVLATRALVIHRRFSSRERVRGVVTADGTELALGVEISSWLRGPRVVQRSFSVATAHGMIPVSGANLVAAIPAASTQLETGEALGVVRPGDTVEIAGHVATPSVEPGAGDPFRTLAGPSAEAIWIAPVCGERGGFASLALELWRPCVAYLLIVTALAVPALAALLG